MSDKNYKNNKKLYMQTIKKAELNYWLQVK